MTENPVPNHAKYGLTAVEAQLLFDAQHGECRICRKRFRPGRPPVVDHHHATGRVRGLLCHACNVTLGQMHEDIAWLRQAVRHLEQGGDNVRIATQREVFVPGSPGDVGLTPKEK